MWFEIWINCIHTQGLLKIWRENSHWFLLNHKQFDMEKWFHTKFGGCGLKIWPARSIWSFRRFCRDNQIQGTWSLQIFYKVVFYRVQQVKIWCWYLEPLLRNLYLNQLEIHYFFLFIFWKSWWWIHFLESDLKGGWYCATFFWMKRKAVFFVGTLEVIQFT